MSLGIRTHLWNQPPGPWTCPLPPKVSCHSLYYYCDYYFWSLFFSPQFNWKIISIHLAFIMEKAMATHSSILAQKIHGQKSLVGCSPWGREESDTTERLHFHFHALEKEMATHSSILAWRIPGMGEPGGLLSMGSPRVGHDWSDLAASAFIKFCSKSEKIYYLDLFWRKYKSNYECVVHSEEKNPNNLPDHIQRKKYIFRIFKAKLHHLAYFIFKSVLIVQSLYVQESWKEIYTHHIYILYSHNIYIIYVKFVYYTLENTLMLGKIEGRRRRGDRGWDGSIASPTQCTWVWANFGR